MKRQALFAIPVFLAVATVSLNYIARRFERAPKLVINKAPERIISTSPAITEMLFALEVEDRLVGVTDFCTYPRAAQKLPKIGGIVKPNLEQLLSLQPDLVLLGNLVSWMQPELTRLGVKTLQLQTFTVKQILNSIKAIGATLGVQSRADGVVGFLELQIQQSKAKVENRPRKKVVLVVGRSPGTLNDLYVVGSGVFLDDLLTYAGGKNIFDDLPLQYAKISKEEIIARSPEIIIESAHSIDPDKPGEKQMKRVWQQLPSVPAVKDDQIYLLNDDYLLLPGPRFVQALDKFKRIVHPEVEFDKPPKP